jgi:transcriptional regulator GlxA family with amidase domain
MRIAIVTFEGFNEIDSFVALHILNRVKTEGWKAEIVAPSDRVTSMNGVTVHTQQPFSFVNQADAVLFGSGKLTRTIIQDEELMSVFQLDPSRQLIGSQCSGALVMKRLGLVENTPICTDLVTRPSLISHLLPLTEIN